jgi:S-DNA-T family DNA segregation ATPase FtsK/SpoIIIE
VIARRSGGAARALYEPVLQMLRDLAAPALLLSGSPEEGPLVGGVRPVPAPPGRGRLVTRRGGVQVVQVAWTEPSS